MSLCRQIGQIIYRLRINCDKVPWVTNMKFYQNNKVLLILLFIINLANIPVFQQRLIWFEIPSYTLQHSIPNFVHFSSFPYSYNPITPCKIFMWTRNAFAYIFLSSVIDPVLCGLLSLQGMSSALTVLC